MEKGYSYFQSSNLLVEIFRESMPIVIAVSLIILYRKRKINIIEVFIYGIATEAYSMIVIGPTFSASLFVSTFFLIDEILQFFRNRGFNINKSYLILLLIPLLVSMIVMLITIFYKDVFYYPNNNKLVFYTKPIYFYLKTYLPYFAIGAKVLSDKENCSFKVFFDTLKRTAKFSFIIAFIQIFVEFVFNNDAIGELVGMQFRYLDMHKNDFFSLRVQALFGEPKLYSAFLSLVIPVFYRDKDYKFVILSVIIGALTQSQTFWVNILCLIIIFGIFKNINFIRVKILLTLAVIVGIFLTISATKDYLFNNYLENQDNPIYEIVAKRAISRYGQGEIIKENEILGLPLQEDLEMPVVNFFSDNLWLLPFGYGPGNSTFINPKYFFGQNNYENHAAGIGANNLSMRWFYVVVEFGLIGFLFYFLILTRTNKNVSTFENNYFAFVWTCLFFSQIDPIFILVALLAAYGQKHNHVEAMNKNSRFINGK